VYNNINACTYLLCITGQLWKSYHSGAEAVFPESMDHRRGENNIIKFLKINKLFYIKFIIDRLRMSFHPRTKVAFPESADHRRGEYYKEIFMCKLLHIEFIMC